jgi:hypothetical protein
MCRAVLIYLVLMALGEKSVVGLHLDNLKKCGYVLILENYIDQILEIEQKKE